MGCVGSEAIRSNPRFGASDTLHGAEVNTERNTPASAVGVGGVEPLTSALSPLDLITPDDEFLGGPLSGGGTP